MSHLGETKRQKLIKAHFKYIIILRLFILITLITTYIY